MVSYIATREGVQEVEFNRMENYVEYIAKRPPCSRIVYWKQGPAGAVQDSEGMKIPPEHFRWYAAFHDEQTHPHVHMVCYSADGKSGFLSENGIAKIKSGLAKQIFRHDLTEIYARQTQQRDALNLESQKRLRQLIQQMQEGALVNEHMEQLVLELARQL